MPKWFIFLAVFVLTVSVTAQTKEVYIRCDLLGKESYHYRYHHPINGVYKIAPQIFSDHKKVTKLLPNLLFIQPADHLKDSLTLVHANSLRYQIDPDDLYYSEKTGSDDSLLFETLDSAYQANETIREEKYKSCVNDYFNPFFISRREVTNYEYRQFRNWVTDSLFRQALFFSEKIKKEEAIQLLKIPRKEHPETSMSKEVLFAHYDLNFEVDYTELFDSDVIAEAILPFYLLSGRRYYKPRVINPEKIEYTYTSGDEGHQQTQILPIIPDTIEIINWFSNYGAVNHISARLISWHPAFDNFPVMGVSWNQAKAFCHWKEQQLRKQYPRVLDEFTCDLPSYSDIEWTVSTAEYGLYTYYIQDDELVTNLKLSPPENESYLKIMNSYPQDTRIPSSPHAKKSKKHSYIQLTNRGFDFRPLINLRFAYMNYLENGVAFLSNNVSEWMNEEHNEQYLLLLKAYRDYHCIAHPSYCEGQQEIDVDELAANDVKGKLIMGSNWYDERYSLSNEVNTAGIFPKRFQRAEKQFATVGFRYVLRFTP